MPLSGGIPQKVLQKLSDVLCSIFCKRRDALQAEVIEAGIADLTLDELGLLKCGPADCAVFSQLLPCRLGPAEHNTESIENRCNEKCDKYDCEIG